MAGIDSSNKKKFDEERNMNSFKQDWRSGEDIVISGVSGKFPESENVKEFRDNLMNGIDMVKENDSRWKPGFFDLPRFSGKMKDISKFDNEYFNLTPKHVDWCDVQVRILMELAYETFADAGIPPESVYNANIGVFVGLCYVESLILVGLEGEKCSQYRLIGVANSMFANRISFAFNLKGPSISVDTACSSGLTCLNLAVSAIRAGHCDSALVAASNICLHPGFESGFQNLGVLTKSKNRIGPFSKDSSGYLRADSVVMIYLQKAKDSKRIYATLIHSKTNTDGHKPEGITFPSAERQISLMKEVYAECNLKPSQLDYLETHGTGTAVGDLVEGESISTVFLEGRNRPLLIGSTKSNIGHSEPASGLCSLVKILIAMEEGVIPKNLHYKEPNPGIPALLDGRLKVVDENTPWNGGLVGLSGFGFGGVNVHVILRSYAKEKSPKDAIDQMRLFAFSGRTEEAVETMLQHVETNNDVNIYGLLADLMDSPAPRHPYRGYSILNSKPPVRKIEKLNRQDRPVWLVFAGMGPQWAGMGKDHMQLDVFRASILNITKIMKPYGINVYDLIMNGDETSVQDLMSNFIAITAIQIALVDTLRVLGIKHDGIIGHSLGEIATAYADGCLTVEETMLSSYWRGKCVIDSTLPPGAMAAVGLTVAEINRTAPPGIVAACHNAEDSVTISGEAETVKAYVEQLKKDNIFVRDVKSSGFAFHCYYMDSIGPTLLTKLKSVITNPKRRSSRWISTSVPESKWDTDLAKTCSAKYMVNNLCSPVLFTETMKFVPSNAIIIEVAPHCILQAILKRSIGPNAIYLGTMKRLHPNNLEYFLTNVGQMYINGMKPTISKLYPPISFPVPRGTAMISPYIKWNHSVTWSYPTADEFVQLGLSGRAVFDVSSQNAPDYYLIDHNIDGKPLIPASAYLFNVWKNFSHINWNLLEEQSIALENVVLHRATLLPKNGNVNLFTQINQNHGAFHTSEKDTVVVTGIAKSYDGSSDRKFYDEPGKKNLPLDKKEIYKELNLRGYKYGPNFQGIAAADLEGKHFMIEWNDNWITFIDAMLQAAILAIPDKILRVPVRIRSIIIDPIRHNKTVESFAENGCIPVMVNIHSNVITSGGVIIEGIATQSITAKSMKQIPVLEEYRFVPYQQQRCFADEGDLEHQLQTYSQICSSLTTKILDKLKGSGQLKTPSERQITSDNETLEAQDNCHLFRTLKSIDELPEDSNFEEEALNILSRLNDQEDFLLDALLSEKILKPIVDVFLENITTRTPKVMEIEGSNPLITEKFLSLLNYYPGLRPAPEYIVTHNNFESLNAKKTPEVSYAEWDVSNEALTGEAIDLIIAKEMLSRKWANIETCLQNIKDSMAPNGFLLLLEPKQDCSIFSGLCALKKQKSAQFSAAEVQDVFQRNGLEIVAYQSDGIYQDLYLLRKTCHKAFEVIPVCEENIEPWLDSLKSKLQSVDSSGGNNLWLLSRDQPINGILGLVNCLRLEPGGERIRCMFLMSPASEVSGFDLQAIVRKNMVMNVYQDGKWGSMRHLPIKSENLRPTNIAYTKIVHLGDLSSLAWYESRLNSNKTSGEQICHVYYSALNFKDIMIATGRITLEAFHKDARDMDKVLGMEYVGRDANGNRIMGLSSQCFATEVIIDPCLVWKIPDCWTMEEAATIPVVYSTVYYAFKCKTNVKPGSSILIHSGSGGVGQAAITVALSYGCEIFTTVGTQEKREFLKKRFPTLKDDHIGNSRDTSFEQMIIKQTNGRGVDYVLNSLTGDKLEASLRCVATHGTFLEIGKYDFLMNNPLATGIFLQDINFHAAMLDLVMVNRNEQGPFLAAMQEGLDSGVIQPLTRTVFDRTEIKEAFRYMAAGKHIGKILVKFREEEPSITKPKPITMLATPRIYGDPKKSVIITGGLGGFGLELTNWLIERGIRHVVLSSRSGVKNGYQQKYLLIWRNKGINVVINTSDITTEAGATELITEAAKYGPVGGIFHLAMVLKDALIENQTEESFMEVVRPKVRGAFFLDKVSRKLCPSLQWFVVFSSVACGRGNIGQTNYAFANSSLERICELRRKEKLPGLAIQWGPIGDVGVLHEATGGVDTVIGGTVTQRIQSCLQVLEKFMSHDYPVVSSLVLEGAKDRISNQERQNLIHNCCTILGIQDISSVDEKQSLANFGIDSLMSVELRQILERDFAISLSLQEVRDLTLERIRQISETCVDVSKANTEVATTQTTANEDQEEQSDSHSFSVDAFKSLKRISALNNVKIGSPIFFIHGYENSMQILEPLASRLNCPVFGLQCTNENEVQSIRNIGRIYLQRIQSVQEKGPYHIAGLTFGANIAVEIAAQLLELKEEVKSLILIDGSHKYSDLLLEHQNGLKSSEEIEAEALCIFLSEFADFNFREVKANFLKLKSCQSCLDYAGKLVRHEHSQNFEVIQSAAKCLLRSIQLAHLDKQRSKYKGATLIVNFSKSKQNSNISTNYEKVIDGQIHIKKFSGDCESVVQNPKAVRLANVINEYLNL